MEDTPRLDKRGRRIGNRARNGGARSVPKNPLPPGPGVDKMGRPYQLAPRSGDYLAKGQGPPPKTVDSPDVAAVIQSVRQGRTLGEAAKLAGLSPDTAYGWMRYPDVLSAMTEARAAGAMAMPDRALEILDDVDQEAREMEDVRRANVLVTSARNRAEYRLRVAAIYNPKASERYHYHVHGGLDGGPIKVEIASFVPSNVRTRTVIDAEPAGEGAQPSTITNESNS